MRRNVLSYLILSYLILSYLILSYLILSYLILSYLILSYLILSYLILSYLILSLTHLLSIRFVLYQRLRCEMPGRIQHVGVTVMYVLVKFAITG